MHVVGDVEIDHSPNFKLLKSLSDQMFEVELANAKLFNEILEQQRELVARVYRLEQYIAHHINPHFKLLD